MNLKNILILAGLIMPASISYAQYTEDALTFSQTEQGGTARIKALGNAQTALGGDISSLAGNPAGLGLFTRSELSFTPEFTNFKSGSTYLNTQSSLQKDKAGLNQLGIVFTIPQTRLKGQDLKTGFLSLNLGISYNKTANYNYTTNYSGVNPRSSFADYVASLADKYLVSGAPTPTSSPFEEGSLEEMAYQNFLIEYNSQGYFAAPNVNNNQRNTTMYSGSQSETNFGLSGNFSNKVYIGASLGLASLNYKSDREFIESGNIRTFAGQDPDFTGGKYRLDYFTTQETEGSGINLKLGLIYKATQNVRFGFGFISPTWYSLKDTYSENLNTSYTKSNGSAIPAYTNPRSIYDTDYSLRTPYKVNAGLAFLGKKGLITADAEFVDYASINFNSSEYELNIEQNRNIKKMYKGAFNFKTGGELKLNPVALRVGFSSAGNPYENARFNLNTYSAGIGYRLSNFFIDLTFVSAVSKFDSKPYDIKATYADYNFTGSGEIAAMENTRNNVFATVGLRF